MRTSNGSNRIDGKGFVRKVLVCWPAVPLFTSLPPTNLPNGRRGTCARNTSHERTLKRTVDTGLRGLPICSPKDSDIEEISRLAPQQQAERLLELAIQQPEFSLGLIHRNLTSWRGHLEDTDHLFHLVLAALNSNDPRVRVAAVEIDLAANNLIKSPESIGKLLKEIQSGSDDRYLALWRLGALGNRGVEPGTVFATLQRYAHDRNQEVRFWSVEGLAMLGNGESIEALLDILAHDSTIQIRERAAHSLSQSGLLTGEQRLTAVPQLLNLLDDDSLDAATQNLVSSTLQAITGESFGKNAGAWRDWWAHHDSPGKSHRMPKNLINA